MQHPPRRQETLMMFTTMVDFSQLASARWATETRLRRNMQGLISNNQLPLDNKISLLRYWLNAWRQGTDSLSRWHLIAYLQESCYWTAFKMMERVSRDSQMEAFKLPEIFHMAISEADVVLNNYLPDLGNDLATYANQVFKSKICEHLYRRKQFRTSSVWSLLRYVSKEMLTAALRYRGLPETTVYKYLLAWLGFKLLYVPKQHSSLRALLPPDPQTWQGIVAYFEREKVQISSPTTPTAQLLEQWLNECAEAVRRYQPQQVSLEVLAHHYERSADEILSDTQLPPLDTAIDNEEQQLKAQINQVLIQAIKQLPTSQRRLIDLRFCEDLSQVQIAEHFNTTQATISRRLAECRSTLFKGIADWSTQTLNQPLNVKLYKAIGIAIDQWLQENYKNQFCADTNTGEFFNA